MTVSTLHGQLGVVAIGRNEGERLRQCLSSVAALTPFLIYVDSGSSDDSVAWAAELGACVVELDPELPFTAGRARNAGWRRLQQQHPDCTFVQFIDGDCTIAEPWCAAALQALQEDADVKVMYGRRRERAPEDSIYHRLLDLEWNTPVGDSDSCGGDAMMRLEALQAVNGFRDDLIAGEEPELCVRLRQKGWRIRRLDVEMTQHDGAMHRLGSWWLRARRAGHAYAEVSWLHRHADLRIWERETRSIWFWGVGWPLLTVTATVALPFWGSLLTLAYPAMFARILWRQAASLGLGDASRFAAFCVLAKFPQALGLLQYHFGRWFRRRSRLMEYK